LHWQHDAGIGIDLEDRGNILESFAPHLSSETLLLLILKLAEQAIHGTSAATR
jgi:hypothetical protein